MKIFATNYLEAMSEDVDSGKGSGKPTKTMMDAGYGGRKILVPDTDITQEGMAGGMLIA